MKYHRLTLPRQVIQAHGERHFHVKGQSLSSAYRYGNSWLMQRYDPLVKEPMRMHYIVPTAVDDKT